MSTVHLDAVRIGDDPASWTGAGFAVEEGAFTVATTAIECAANDGEPSWRLWTEGIDRPDHLDGIPTAWADTLPERAAVRHPNRVVEIDHIVLQSPDLDRTTEAFAALGVECRRIRDVPGAEPAMQQRFFRFGPVILELVGTPEPTGDGSASIWGFAFTVDDIDAAAAHLGAGCSDPKDAVQAGRRIATVRTRDLGISVPVALMTPDPRSSAPRR